MVDSVYAVQLLQSVIALGVLTLVMFLWMYATRIPAMNKAQVDPQAAMHPGSLGVLPSEVRRVADNYNHLFEAPTLFYGLVPVIVLLGHADALHVKCAWAYVGLRVLHSLVQATINKVMIRFLLFSLSWVAMGIMIVREAIAAFA
ncbi:MAPEG family protein [Parapedomonas caeni]